MDRFSSVVLHHPLVHSWVLASVLDVVQVVQVDLVLALVAPFLGQQDQEVVRDLQGEAFPRVEEAFPQVGEAFHQVGEASFRVEVLVLVQEVPQVDLTNFVVTVHP